METQKQKVSTKSIVEQPLTFQLIALLYVIGLGEKKEHNCTC